MRTQYGETYADMKHWKTAHHRWQRGWSWRYCVQWSQPLRVRQIPCAFTSMWKRKNNKNKTKQKQTHRCWEETMAARGESSGGLGEKVKGLEAQIAGYRVLRGREAQQREDRQWWCNNWVWGAWVLAIWGYGGAFCKVTTV